MMIARNSYGSKKKLLLLPFQLLKNKSTTSGGTSYPSSSPIPRYHHHFFSRPLRPSSPWPSSPKTDALPSGFAAAFLLPKPAAAALAKAYSSSLPSAAAGVGLRGLVGGGLRTLRISLQRRPSGGFGSAGRRFSSSLRGLWRRYLPTPDGLLLSLIGANVAVFFLWTIADPKFMMQHFTVSLDNIKNGRLHTLITCAFSHSDLSHLVSNLIGLYFFGLSIGNLFGPRFLLNLYLAGALGGSIFFLAHQAFMAPPSRGYRGWDQSRVYALGASGAVNAILLLEVFLFPKNIYYVNFIIPVPAMVLGALWIGTDLWRMKKGDSNISGEAHLGGAFVAALVWARVKKGWI